MPKPPSLADVYQRASTPDELRRIYVNQSPVDTHECLTDQFDKMVIKDLLSGEYMAIGYSLESGPAVIVIESHEWRFLELDFEKNLACRIASNQVIYADLRCINKNLIPSTTDHQVGESHPNQSVEQPLTLSHTSFAALGANTWDDITLRLLHNYQIRIKGPTSMFTTSIALLELLDKRQQTPNQSYAVLLGMSQGLLFPKSKKMPVSKLRIRLKNFFRTKSDPFQLIDKIGYLTRFSVYDDRNQ
jgi:hypothetical protein